MEIHTKILYPLTYKMEIHEILNLHNFENWRSILILDLHNTKNGDPSIIWISITLKMEIHLNIGFWSIWKWRSILVLDTAMTENGDPLIFWRSIPTSLGDIEWISKMETHGHLDLHFTYPSSNNGVDLYFGQSFKLNHPSRKYGVDLHFEDPFYPYPKSGSEYSMYIYHFHF